MKQLPLAIGAIGNGPEQSFASFLAGPNAAALAHLRPGQRLRFAAVTREQALRDFALQCAWTTGFALLAQRLQPQLRCPAACLTPTTHPAPCWR